MVPVEPSVSIPPRGSSDLRRAKNEASGSFTRLSHKIAGFSRLLHSDSFRGIFRYGTRLPVSRIDPESSRVFPLGKRGLVPVKVYVHPCVISDPPCQPVVISSHNSVSAAFSAERLCRYEPWLGWCRPAQVLPTRKFILFCCRKSTGSDHRVHPGPGLI
jgi:hypothetical protein